MAHFRELKSAYLFIAGVHGDFADKRNGNWLVSVVISANFSKKKQLLFLLQLPYV